jgi:segregation and condensation protein B
MNDQTVNLAAQIEALLFVHGEPMKLKRLAELLGLREEELRQELARLAERLQAAGDRGLGLIVANDEVQLVTKPVLAHLVGRLVKEELDSGLTPASLETLAIIAYLGPCSRALIEEIRGVNSSFILRSLLVRGLIERQPDPRRPNAFLYQPSFEFLRHLGLTQVEHLPDYEKYRQLIHSFLGGPEAGQNIAKTDEEGRK